MRDSVTPPCLPHPLDEHLPPAHGCWDAIDATIDAMDQRAHKPLCALTDFASLTAVSKLLQVVGYPAGASVGGEVVAILLH